MYLRHQPYGIEIQAPAKLNLFFEILSKRTDGFHDVETLMIPISLYDTLYFKNISSKQIELDCRWASGVRSTELEAVGDLPPAEENLVYQALVLLRKHAGIQQGAECRLIKRIPSASGLGGASSDAAAALIAANECWNLGYSSSQLSGIGAQLGSDIPFFIYSQAAVCQGRGEKITLIDKIGQLNIVIARPPVGLSTADVYRNAQVPEKPRGVESIVNALKTQNNQQLGQQLWNRLQESASRMTGWIDRLREAFSQVDCIGHQMSGSGSSYFGLFRNARQAQLAGRLLASRNVGHVYVVQNLH